MPFPDKFSPEDLEFLEKMNIDAGKAHETEKTCPCPVCRMKRGELPRPTREDIKRMERWANRILSQLPSTRSRDLAVSIGSAVMAGVFVGYAVGIDHARRESSDGDVDRGL